MIRNVMLGFIVLLISLVVLTFLKLKIEKIQNPEDFVIQQGTPTNADRIKKRFDKKFHRIKRIREKNQPE